MHSNLQLIIKGKVSWHACLWWPCVVYGGVYDSSRTLHGKYCANSVSDHNIRTQITYYLYPHFGAISSFRNPTDPFKSIK